MSTSIPKEAVFDETNPRHSSHFLAQMKTLFSEAAPDATNEQKHTFARLEKSISRSTFYHAEKLKEQRDAEIAQMSQRLASTKHNMNEVEKAVDATEKNISVRKNSTNKAHLHLVELIEARRLLREEWKEKMEKHEKDKDETLLKNNKLELKWIYEDAREQLRFELNMLDLQEEKDMLELDIAFSKDSH